MAEVAEQGQDPFAVGRNIVNDKDRGHGLLLHGSMKSGRAGGGSIKSGRAGWVGDDGRIEGLPYQGSSFPIRGTVLEAGRAA